MSKWKDTSFNSLEAAWAATKLLKGNPTEIKSKGKYRYFTAGYYMIAQVGTSSAVKQKLGLSPRTYHPWVAGEWQRGEQTLEERKVHFQELRGTEIIAGIRTLYIKVAKGFILEVREMGNTTQTRCVVKSDYVPYKSAEALSAASDYLVQLNDH